MSNASQEMQSVRLRTRLVSKLLPPVALVLSILLCGSVVNAAPPAQPDPAAAAKEAAAQAGQKPPAGTGSQTDKPVAPRMPLDCQTNDGGAVTKYAVAPGTSHLLVQLAGNISWQPRDGRIRFVVTTTDNTAPSKIDGIETAVCFGWPPKVFATSDTSATERFYKGAYLRTVARTENSITYETGMPDGLWQPNPKAPPPTVADILWRDVFTGHLGKAKHVYDGLGLVPIVHMRVVARTQGAADVANDANLMDTIVPVGVSFRLMALGVMLFAIAVAWGLLIFWGKGRNIKGDPILRIITDKGGYASLTQFQILLWTVVIGAGITYVMVITGSLIDVPIQVLALLGIAGFSALSATYAAKKEEANAAPQPPPPPLPPGQLAPQPTPRDPNWSDLVILDKATSDNIDITRVQMLVFTVLAACFVAIKICDESTIPIIPDGIILLMGLTNGVYVGGRLMAAQK